MDNKLSTVDSDGKETVVYEAQPYQAEVHESSVPNVLMLGTRGSGKSKTLRFDAHLRCLMFPHFRALIVRRTMPELRKSHLNFIEREMKMLGGEYLVGTFVAKYPNGSSITFGHCETEKDVMNFLGSEYGLVIFDELSTFTLQQFLLISAAARSTEDAAYMALVRCGSNTLGVGSAWMKAWFIDKNVRLEDFPDYHPEDFKMFYSSFRDNKYIDQKDYERRLRALPKHVRDSWLEGKFVVEGAYFTDFEPEKEIEEGTDKIVPWHVIEFVPKWHDRHQDRMVSIFEIPWITIYRAIDWGYFPDPAVCLWIAVLPNGRAIVFKEDQWLRTTAQEVAKSIKRQSEGMKIAETFCDPSMFIKTGETDYSIGELFEINGVPLTAAANKRELFGYSIHDYLNTCVDELPKLQIIRGMGGLGAPNLIRTLPIQQMDDSDPRKIAAGEDHWVVALAYFCMGSVPASRNYEDPIGPTVGYGMIPSRVTATAKSNHMNHRRIRKHPRYRGQ